MAEAVDGRAGGAEVSACGSAKKRYLAMCQDWSGLEEHDRRFHPNGFREGDSCRLREDMAKGDASEKALAEAASGRGDAGGAGVGSILDDVSGLAKRYVEMRGELRKKANLPYEEYQREKDLVNRALDRFEEALKDTPWSAFGDDPDRQDNKLSDFSAKLPREANIDALIDDYVELDDDAESIYDPDEAFGIFVDCHADGDKTLGDTLKRAIPHIEAKFNEQAAEERDEREEERLPLTAYLEGR